MIIFRGSVCMSQMRAAATWLIVVTALVGAFARPARAQNTGVIEGTVADEQGGVMPGVTMTLRNTETGVERAVTTEGAGTYRFPALQPGTYSLTASLQGFASERLRDIALTIGLNLRYDITLKLQALAETISVTAEAPVVDVTKSEVAGVVTQKQIETLPINTRQYLNLALLMPGTSQDAVRVFYNNVNIGAGGSFYSNAFVADGVTNTWTEQGEPRQNFPQDSIREFKVNTMQYKAEYGLATGGLVTVVSRSGANASHGNLFEYFRDKALNTQNHFEKTKPDYRRNQFGASLGGPIRKDRTHFFAAIERTQEDNFFTVNTGRPDLYAAVEGTFPQPRHVTLTSIRVDHTLNSAQSLFVRYAQEGEFTQCAASTCGGRNAANAGYDMNIPRRSVVVGHTTILSARALNDFRFQYAFAAYQIAPPGQLIWTDVGQYPTERIGAQRVARRLQFPSLVWGGNYEALGPEKRFQVKDSFTYHAPDWVGSHDWKVGIDFSHIPFADDSQVNLNGTYQFGNDQSFNPDDATSIASLRAPILFTMTTPASYVPMPSQYLGIFIQDDWRPIPKLTLNAGLRYDLQIGAFNTDVRPDQFRIPIPLINPAVRGDRNNVGPRLGLAYDAAGDGATVLRGGYGIYYDNIRMLQNQYEKLNMLRYDIRITNPSYPDPFQGRDPLQFASTAPPNIQLLANDFRNPRSQQANVGLTRQLSSDLAVHADGVYSRIAGDRKTVNVNVPDAASGQRASPQFGRIDVDQSISKSAYRALYVRLDKRYSRNYQYLVSYSLVQGRDNNPAGRFVDQANRDLDWGPANFDRRHSFVASGAVQVPFDVQLGAVFTIRSSLPFSATAGRDLNGDTFVTDYVPGTSRNQGNRDLDLTLVNTWRASAGLLPIASIDSTRFSSVDVRASKPIRFAGERRAEVIVQLFNAFNTVNLSGLGTNAVAATFGVASRASAGRQAEVAVRLVW